MAAARLVRGKGGGVIVDLYRAEGAQPRTLRDLYARAVLRSLTDEQLLALARERGFDVERETESEDD